METVPPRWRVGLLLNSVLTVTRRFAGSEPYGFLAFCKESENGSLARIVPFFPPSLDHNAYNQLFTFHTAGDQVNFWEPAERGELVLTRIAEPATVPLRTLQLRFQESCNEGNARMSIRPYETMMGESPNGFLNQDSLNIQNSGGGYQRQRQMTIGDLLLENRIIFLDGPIHDASANLIVMKNVIFAI